MKCSRILWRVLGFFAMLCSPLRCCTILKYGFSDCLALVEDVGILSGSCGGGFFEVLSGPSKSYPGLCRDSSQLLCQSSRISRAISETFRDSFDFFQNPAGLFHGSKTLSTFQVIPQTSSNESTGLLHSCSTASLWLNPAHCGNVDQS